MSCVVLHQGLPVLSDDCSLLPNQWRFVHPSRVGRDVAALCRGGTWQWRLQGNVSSAVRDDLRAIRCDRSLRGTRTMAKTRRYSIVVKDEKSNAVVVTAAVDWTSDDKHIAVGQIHRLPGLGEGKGITHRLSQGRAAKAAAKLRPARKR